MTSLPMTLPQDFPLATSVTCATLVAAAYDQYYAWIKANCPPINAFDWTPNLPDFSIIGGPLHWSYHVLFTDYVVPIGFLAVSKADQTVYLVFRGTVSDEDRLNDATITQTTYALAPGFGSVHAGFYDIYSQLSPQVHAGLALAATSGPVPQLVITGHSMGGGLSTLALPDVVTNCANVAQTIVHLNLASPRVGAPSFTAALNALAPKTWRVVNTEDIVPDAPLAAAAPGLLYTHVGTPVDFTANYLSIDGNHALVGAYTYALQNPTSPWNQPAAVAAAQAIAVQRAAPTAAAQPPAATVAPTSVAQAVAAHMMGTLVVHTTDAQGKVL